MGYGDRRVIRTEAGVATGDVVAAPYAMNRTPNVFTEGDVEILAAQARIAEIAIRNAAGNRM